MNANSAEIARCVNKIIIFTTWSDYRTANPAEQYAVYLNGQGSSNVTIFCEREDMCT